MLQQHCSCQMCTATANVRNKTLLNTTTWSENTSLLATKPGPTIHNTSVQQNAPTTPLQLNVFSVHTTDFRLHYYWHLERTPYICTATVCVQVKKIISKFLFLYLGKARQCDTWRCTKRKVIVCPGTTLTLTGSKPKNPDMSGHFWHVILLRVC